MLKGIEKDVPFDSGTAEQLIAGVRGGGIAHRRRSVGHGRRGRRWR